MRAYLAAVLCLFLSAVSSLVMADTPVQVTVEGQCPTRETFVVALGQSGVVVEDSANITLRVHSDGMRASLAMQVHKSPVVVREVQSHDCIAIADVFAMIASDAISNIEQDSVSEVETESPVATTSPRIAKRAAISKPVFSERAPKISDKLVHSPIALGLMAGIAAPNNTHDPTAILQMDVILRLKQYGIRTALWTTSETQFGADLNRQSIGISTSIGPIFSYGSRWIHPTAGLGLGGTRISSATSASQTMIRIHPIVRSSLSLGWKIAPSISLRADVRVHGYPINDRYSSASAGVVGKSPRIIFVSGLGMEWRVR